jgi:hypothetical protein
VKFITDKRDTAAIAAEILERIRQEGALYKTNRVKAHFNHIRNNELRDVLANRFAYLRGWKHSLRSFSLTCLARGGVHGGGGYWGTGSMLQYHPYFFRDQRRHAVAIASHLYSYGAEKAEECRIEAAAHGPRDRGGRGLS